MLPAVQESDRCKNMNKPDRSPHALAVGSFTLENKKISELDGIVGLESDKVIAIHFTTLRAWAIAVVKKQLKEKELEDGKIKFEHLIRFLIDRFEIKPEELK